MAPALRRLVLTTHIISSVGWLGAVVAFLALSISGFTNSDPARVRGAYLAMEMIGWLVIVPLSLASLVTGLINSLASAWGLFRHYWVIFKLLIAIVATGLLLLHMQPTSYVATVATNTTLTPADLRSVRIQLIADAGAAIVVLVIATVLSVYKPRGLTRYGWRKEQERRSSSPE